MDRNRIRQTERIHACLAVAVGYATMLKRHALDAAGQVERPRHRIRIGGIHLGDGGHLRFGQILVPAELLQHGKGEFRVAVLDFRILRIRSVRQQADLPRCAVGKLLLAFESEAGPERPAAVHHAEIGIVKQRRARMPHLG